MEGGADKGGRGRQGKEGQTRKGEADKGGRGRQGREGQTREGGADEAVWPCSHISGKDWCTLLAHVTMHSFIAYYMYV